METANYHVRRARKRQLRNERRAKAIKAVLYIVLGLVIVLLLLGMSGQKDNYSEETVIVPKGGTLWNIAREYCPDSMDIRDYIDDMRTDNSCTDIIYPGQALTVRVYEEGKQRK